ARAEDHVVIGAVDAGDEPEDQPRAVHLGQLGLHDDLGPERAGPAVLQAHRGTYRGEPVGQLRRDGGTGGRLRERPQPRRSPHGHAPAPHRRSGVGLGNRRPDGGPQPDRYCPGHSMTAIRSPSWTTSPSPTASFVSVPGASARTGISIFIDSRMTSVSPSATASPSDATTCHTFATISARTSVTRYLPRVIAPAITAFLNLASGALLRHRLPSSLVAGAPRSSVQAAPRPFGSNTGQRHTSFCRVSGSPPGALEARQLAIGRSGPQP